MKNYEIWIPFICGFVIGTAFVFLADAALENKDGPNYTIEARPILDKKENEKGEILYTEKIGWNIYVTQGEKSHSKTTLWVNKDFGFSLKCGDENYPGFEVEANSIYLKKYNSLGPSLIFFRDHTGKFSIYLDEPYRGKCAIKDLEVL